MKVKCINRLYSIFTVGRVYEAQLSAGGNYIIGGGIYATHCFEAVPIMTVQCIDNKGEERYLNENFTYEVVEEVGHTHYMLAKLSGLWPKSRFVVVKPKPVRIWSKDVDGKADTDPEESRLRAILTRSSDPFTCNKCGAPKSACERNNYH